MTSSWNEGEILPLQCNAIIAKHMNCIYRINGIESVIGNDTPSDKWPPLYLVNAARTTYDTFSLWRTYCVCVCVCKMWTSEFSSLVDRWYVLGPHPRKVPLDNICDYTIILQTPNKMLTHVQSGTRAVRKRPQIEVWRVTTSKLRPAYLSAVCPSVDWVVMCHTLATSYTARLPLPSRSNALSWDLPMQPQLPDWTDPLIDGTDQFRSDEARSLLSRRRMYARSGRKLFEHQRTLNVIVHSIDERHDRLLPPTTQIHDSISAQSRARPFPQAQWHT